MKGCEIELGTPTEDMFTLQFMEYALALHQRDCGECAGKQDARGALLLLGVDVDLGDRVLLQDLEDRLSQLSPEWIQNLSVVQESTRKYVEAVLQGNSKQSIVHSLRVGAIKGLRWYEIPPWLPPRLNDSHNSFVIRWITFSANVCIGRVFNRQ